MSAIYKLSISGVRSFDARQSETIEFGKPLTLIVGPNGTGKTTIIECLKYATTGDMPPNSKGGAFVHDPGMYGEKEVKAEVKLAFQSLSGNSMVCTRNMQVIAKKGNAANTFKTLEGQLLQMHNGERTTISTKCAELDDLVPKNLGTPTPILDYVIFCHQEDSLWPLAEPAHLKKRFDEIFEALKFTKALDNLKVIRKEMGVEIKLLDQSVKHLRLDKDRAQRTREKLEKNQEIIKRYTEETAILEDEIQLLTKESDELFKSNQDYQEILSKIESMKHERRSVTEQINRLHDSCTLIPEDDEVLQYRLANFRSILTESTERVNGLKTTVKSFQSELKTLRDEHSALIGEEGQLKSKQNEYEMNLMSREDISEKLNDTYHIPLSDDFEAIQEALEHVVEEHQSKLESIQSKSQEQEQKLQLAIQEVSNSKLKELQHRQYAMTDITNLTSENKSTQERINNLNVNEGNLEYEKSSLESLEEKLKAAKSSKGVEGLTQEIRTKNNEVSTVENELESVAHDISQTHKHSDAHAKISLLTDELKFKDAAMAKLLEVNKATLDEYGIDTGNLLSDYNGKISSTKSELKNREKELSQKQRNAEKLSNTIDHNTSSHDKLKESINTAADKFKDHLPDEEVEDYVEVVQSAEEDYKIALENLKMKTTTLQFNQKALEVAQATDCCYLCSRKFEDTNGLHVFIDELKKRTDAGYDKELQDQLEDTKAYLESVRSLSSYVDTISSNKPKLEEIAISIASDTEELNELKGQIETLKKATEGLRSKVNDFDALRNPVNEIVRLKEDTKTIREQLDSKQQELNDYGYSTKSLDDLQRESTEKSEKLKSLRRGITRLQEEKESLQRELTILEGNVKDKRLMISNMERSLIERENLLRTIEDNKKKISSLQDTVSNADSIVSELEEKLKVMTTELETVKEYNYTTITDVRKTVSSALDALSELSSLNKKINDYANIGINKLQDCQKRISTVTDMISKLEQDITTTLQTVSEEEVRLADSASEERNIRSNLDLNHLQIRLSQIEADIAAADVSNAEAQRDKYQARSNELRQEYTNARSELAGKRGEMRQIEDQCVQLNREIETEFKDVEKNYKEEWTKLQTRTVVNDDLQTYSKALDSAIMSYHALKMKEINRIIDELWKSTYSGSDVDAIKIKSEQSGKGNKSYNYRVVMVKQDAELDMRGRCSAGQKVLAAIIIRLALAECFGTNCGVIALDEPTTNLDADNIESLAHSLGRIIEMRKSQKNFQLIVITHDEKFLNSMGASKYTDHFFRLKRDDSQNSQIEWVDITRVVE